MKHLLIALSLLLSLQALGQDLNVESNTLTPFIQALHNFSKNVPQEKVYLHFDNTSYYQGDNIWFACYVTTGQNKLSPLSKTLYVELLNPGGELIDKRILPVENGQCHGNFSLNHLPFYSGFYEVRAYTKYMLNFGEDVIFSRLLPVFDKPKTEGNYEEKAMLKYSRFGLGNNYPMKRKSPEKGKSVNVRFFPEGGNPIQGTASRIAFEATDKTGNPIDIAGVVLDEKKQELCRFSSFYEGRGVFTFTPDAGKQTAEVEYSGKKYSFDLPAALPQGVGMEVDNLSDPDSIGITLRKSRLTPAEMLGLVVLTGGVYQSYRFVSIKEEAVSIKINKTNLPLGVSQIVLFNNQGDILCDRLVFTGKNDFLNINVKTGKPTYKPYEPIDMEISAADRQSNPVQSTFSLSVRDAANEVEYKQNIMTDLLLMSEIKGYVRNPSYYFESDDSLHRKALDLLLMVQGWRRYSWKQMTGTGSLELKHLPEQGIEIDGKVVSLVKQVPKSNVNLSLLLLQKKDGEPLSSIIGSSVTDSLGRFSFTSDVQGKWSLILKVSEKNKGKNYWILLDRIFNPEPKRYRYSDLQITIAGKNTENKGNEETTPGALAEDADSLLAAYPDSLMQEKTAKKIHNLPELVVKAKRNSEEQDIRRNRSTSIVYYDVSSEMNNFYDRGKYAGNDVDQLLTSINKNFSIILNSYNTRRNESLLYNLKPALVVVDYQPVLWRQPDLFDYQTLDLSAIRSIYINENTSAIAQYIISNNIREYSPMDLALMCSCVVFIETYPKEDVPVEGDKGVRKTWLEGYSEVKEFYSPDYSTLTEEPDYRRTLYWNPAITMDSTGIAKIHFYNNSSCKNLSISAETITPDGKIGVK